MCLVKWFTTSLPDLGFRGNDRMSSDSIDHIVPDEQHCDEAVPTSGSFLIALGAIVGTCHVLAIEFWLKQHIRGDSFVITGILFGSLISTNRWRIARYAGVWTLLGSVALLCGIAADHAEQQLKWPTAALVAIGGMSGGLIAVLAVAIRSYLSKRGEFVDDGTSSQS